MMNAKKNVMKIVVVVMMCVLSVPVQAGITRQIFDSGMGASFGALTYLAVKHVWVSENINPAIETFYKSRMQFFKQDFTFLCLPLLAGAATADYAYNLWNSFQKKSNKSQPQEKVQTTEK